VLVSLSLCENVCAWVCVCVCVCVWQWQRVGMGYNCIALPFHSVSTPICLFNIQLSTLDLEALQQHIHGWLLKETTKVIEKEDDRETRKRNGKQKNKVQNVVSATKVNKRTWWMDPASTSRKKNSELDTEMRSRSLVNSFNLKLTWFFKDHSHRPLKKCCYFNRKYAGVDGILETKNISYLPPGNPSLLLRRMVHSGSSAFGLS